MNNKYTVKQVKEITHKIKSLKKEGKTYREIADIFNKQGMKTILGKPWNSVYAQHFVYYRIPGNEKVTRMATPPVAEKKYVEQPKTLGMSTSLYDKIHFVCMDSSIPNEAKLKIIEIYLRNDGSQAA